MRPAPTIEAQGKILQWVQGATPDSAPAEVAAVYRILAVLRVLDLCKSASFYAATSRLSVARLVISRLIEMP